MECRRRRLENFPAAIKRTSPILSAVVCAEWLGAASPAGCRLGSGQRTGRHRLAACVPRVVLRSWAVRRTGEITGASGSGLALKKIDPQQPTVERRAVGGPLFVAAVHAKNGARGAHLGIEIVEIMQDQGFAKHGQLRRAEFVLAVMADQKVLDQSLQVGRKSFDRVHLLGDLLELENDVPEQLALGRCN